MIDDTHIHTYIHMYIGIKRRDYDSVEYQNFNLYFLIVRNKCTLSIITEFWNVIVTKVLTVI